MGAICTQCEQIVRAYIIKAKSVVHPLQLCGASSSAAWGILFRCGGVQPLQVCGVASSSDPWGIRGIYEQPHRQPRRTRLPEWGGGLTWRWFSKKIFLMCKKTIFINVVGSLQSFVPKDCKEPTTWVRTIYNAQIMVLYLYISVAYTLSLSL